MKSKIRMLDVLIDSIYLASDDDSSILSDDPRLKDEAFLENVSLAVSNIEHLIGRKKTQLGLDKAKKIEMVIDRLREMGSRNAKNFLEQLSPNVEELAIQQFYRKLSDESSRESLDEDHLYLRIINNIDSISIENRDEEDKS